LDIYKITSKFPKEERYGLVSQIRRSSISELSNIAEGYGRKTTADYIRFLYNAYGSNCELETQMLLSGDLGYIESIKLEGLPAKVNGIFDKDQIQGGERMLKALIKSLENKHLSKIPRTFTGNP